MDIVIVSANRAGKVKTHRLVEGYSICIPESEREAYAEHHDESVLECHPDSVIGLVPKLNWVLESRRDTDLLILDDDLKRFKRLFHEAGVGRVSVSRAVVMELLHNAQEMARESGAFFWGFAGGGSFTHNGFRPYLTKAYINGITRGFCKGHGLEFDVRFAVKQDYDISCEAMWKHGRVWLDRRYGFEQDLVSEGGQAGQRNAEIEAREVEMLQAKWGDCVVVKDAERSEHEISKSYGRTQKARGVQHLHLKVDHLSRNV